MRSSLGWRAKTSRGHDLADWLVCSSNAVAVTGEGSVAVGRCEFGAGAVCEGRRPAGHLDGPRGARLVRVHVGELVVMRTLGARNRTGGYDRPGPTKGPRPWRSH